MRELRCAIESVDSGCPNQHYTKYAQVKSMDDNCGEWVECMGVASGCGYQEVGVASGSGWNLWVWLVGGMYGCGYQEVGVVGRRRVWLAGGIYGGGYQEVGVVVVGIYWCG